MRPKICVLMSTYNGHKYIREQIDSVLNQQDVEVRLLIRDDFSTDDTVSILKEYASKDNRVKFYTGSNLGPCQSFFNLINNAEDYPYYAFCDQDDVWDINKLSIAVNNLDNVSDDTPCLYCSNLNVVDQNLNFLHRCINYKIDANNKLTPLVEFYAVGCTEVFNRKAFELVRSHISSECMMHDLWLNLICSFLGKVIYDPVPHIKYRQHGNNVVGTISGRSGMFKTRIKRLINDAVQPRYRSAKAFYNEFSSLLTISDKAEILKIINYKDSLYKRLRLLLDFDIKASNFRRDIRYRLLILFGKI